MDFDNSFPSAPVRYAYDEDDTDDEQLDVSTSQKQYRVSTELTLGSISENVKWTFIIGLKGPGNVYLSSLRDQNLFQVGVVRSFINEDNDESEKKATSSIKAKIFRIEDQATMLVPFTQDIEAEEAAAYTKSLLKEFPDDVGKIILLDSFTATGYISEKWGEDFIPPLLRVLQTSSAPTIPQLPVFEIPNMVKGLSASILNYCEMYRIPCYNLLSLQESLYGKLLVTSETLEAYQQGLSCLGHKDLIFDEALMTKELEAEHNGRVDDSHHRLYM